MVGGVDVHHIFFEGISLERTERGRSVGDRKTAISALPRHVTERRKARM